MTEEIIIDCAFYKDGVCASPINKTCEYCKNIDMSKCYHKQLKHLEQENKELLEARNHFMRVNLKYFNALEEINRTLLGVRGLSINCEKQIEKVKAIINEVLNDK